jgi:hypothetical protein
MQKALVGVAKTGGAVCLTIYMRSSSGHWKNGPKLAEDFPYWIIAIPPAMAFVLKLKEQV